MAFWENVVVMVNGRIAALDWPTVCNLHTNEAARASCARRLDDGYLRGVASNAVTVIKSLLFNLISEFGGERIFF